MSKELSLEQFYPKGKYQVIDIADKNEIKKLLESKSSNASGSGPIGDTGYYRLSHSSAYGPRKRALILVCKTSNLDI